MNIAQAMKVLGLANDAGEDEIRRAYAQRLKTTHPEDDPEGFKTLRQAYEVARQRSRYRRPAIEETPEPDRAAAEPRTPQEEARGRLDSVDFVETEEGEEEEAGNEGDAPGLLVGPPPENHAAHGAICNRLAEALSAQASEPELRSALEDILHSPGLANVDIYNQTETWLINLLARTRPASYPLLDRAIEFFRWENIADHRNQGPGFILSLRARIPNEKRANEFIARVKDKRHEFNRAYRQLLEPPEKRSWLSRLLALRHGDLVERFLTHIQQKVPVAIEALDTDALAWWRRRRGGVWPWILGLGSVVGQMALLLVVVVGGLMLAQSSGLLPDASSPERSLWVETRGECEHALIDMKSLASDEAIAKADRLCRPELVLAPDSLTLMQRLGEIDLAAGHKGQALVEFDQILAASPDDPLALFGKGLASSDAALLSEAVTRSPDVIKHFIALPVGVPAVKPMEQEPKSRLLAQARAPFDAPPKRITDKLSDDQMSAILKHFRRARTPVGKAVLDCIVGKDGMLVHCLIASEFPYDEGVGEVALRMAGLVKFEPAKLSGEAVEAPITYRITLLGNAQEQAKLQAAEEKANADRMLRRGYPPAPPKPAFGDVPVPVPVPVPGQVVATSPQKPAVSEAMQRVLARDECDKLAESVRAGKAGGGDQMRQAETICRRELGKAPESLVLRQHLALIALAAGKAEDAATLFDDILAISPNDPYALYGKGEAASLQNSSADTAILAEALKRDHAVQAYFSRLPLTFPDVAPMAGDPQSHVVKRPIPKSDTKVGHGEGSDDGLMLKLLRRFGLRQSPVGRVVLNCLVRAEGRLSNCVIVEEQPYNQGVGEFAIAMAYGEKFGPAKLNGEPVDNMPLNYTVQLLATKEALDRLKKEEDGDKPPGAGEPAPSNPPKAP